MTNRYPLILTFLALAILIAVMSWRDLHPQAPRLASSGGIAASFFVNAKAATDMVPEDPPLPLLVAQGTFKYAKSGKMLWTPNALEPMTFAQRQVGLEVHFDNLPKDPQETLGKIDALMQAWDSQGTTVSAIYINYRPARPDFKAYADFAEAFHNYFKSNGKLLIAVADPAWLDEKHKPGLAALTRKSKYTGSNISGFVLDLPGTQIPPQLAAQLDKFQYYFLLRLPAGVLPQDIDEASFKKLKMLASCIYTLSPQRPWPVREQKIGLFPKF